MVPYRGAWKGSEPSKPKQAQGHAAHLRRPTTSRPRQAKRPQDYARDDFCWDMLGQVPETAAGSEFEDSESSWDEAGARRVSLG